jgi:hypothetical protein
MHPHRDHDREVERSNPGNDPKRLSKGEDVDASRYLIGVLAFEQVRNSAGELDDLQPALNLAPGVREHLAMFVGNDFGQLVQVPVHQLSKCEEDLASLTQ